ncbi:hypothetical protein [Azospirillum sp. TSA2s]|nr:hypothetical protein [Azospirillum sp. TSA2s]
MVLLLSLSLALLFGAAAMERAAILGRINGVINSGFCEKQVHSL